MTERTILILSGGIDSVVLLYKLISENKEVFCLIFDYGQKARKEIDCAIEICHILNINYQLVDISNLASIIWNNTLINEEVFDLDPYEADIPSRNTLFLEIATAYAITYDYDSIYIGIIKAKEIFSPDTTQMFIDKLNDLHLNNNWKNIPVKAPLLDKTKSEVILLANELDVPLDKTWTCFYNEDEECGVCDSCISKKEALEEANLLITNKEVF